MANLKETAYWEEGIYQWETTDPVLGAVCNWYCGGFYVISRALPRCKSSQGVQPCCGLRLA